MISHKKSPDANQGLSQKVYPHSNKIPTEYHGSFNQIPTENKVIDSYLSCLDDWLVSRTKYHTGE